MRTVVVRWEGPHTLESVKASKLRNGLYFLSGRRKGKRSNRILYFGITKRDYHKRINHNHQAWQQIREETRRVWLGQIEYPQRFTEDHLKLAEKCLIYFWQPELNKIGKISPSEPVCIVSRWTKLNGEVRKNRLGIYKELPDILWWGEDEYWRTGNLTLWQNW